AVVEPTVDATDRRLPTCQSHPPAAKLIVTSRHCDFYPDLVLDDFARLVALLGNVNHGRGESSATRLSNGRCGDGVAGRRDQRHREAIRTVVPKRQHDARCAGGLALYVEQDVLGLALVEAATDVDVVFTLITRGDDDYLSRPSQLAVQTLLSVGAVMCAPVV